MTSQVLYWCMCSEGARALPTVLAPLGVTVVAAQSQEDVVRRIRSETFLCLVVEFSPATLEQAGNVVSSVCRRSTDHLIPVLALVPDDTAPALVRSLYASGAVDVVSEALLPEALQVKIRSLLERAKAAQKPVRRLAETVPALVWVTDPEAKAVYLNHRWVDYTGVDEEKLLGYGWHETIHPDDVGTCRNAWQAARSSLTPYSISVRYRRHDGQYRWHAVRGSPETNAEDQLIQWYGASIDIHDLITAREELERANRELALARDDALEASRAKSTFLAMMSHELRTPLNAVIGYAELLREEMEERNLEGNVLSDLERIHAAARHLMMVIGDVLDLSNVETGRMQLQLEDVDATQMLQEAAELSAPLAEARHNSLRIADDAQCPEIHLLADRVRLRQVLFNLLSNAAKFTEQGEIRLSCRQELDGEGNPQVAISITDTGIGIPSDQLNLLFEPFRQLDPSSTRKYGGTGLGLIISRRLAEMMGGSISAESEPGHGSTFTVRLPVHGSGDPAAQA